MKKKDLQQQLEMIARGNHDEIMDYIEEYYLDDAAEVALIKRGNHDEIMAYVSEYVLEEEVQKALIERGNAEEIETMNELPTDLEL